jgi:tetratricopeptide (TPR) repeat protein
MHNKIFQLTLAMVVSYSCASPAQAAGKNFNGVWLWKAKDSSYELHLVQKGQKIKGAHFAAIGDGRRCDNQEHPDLTGPSIVGKVVGSKADVQITSSYSDTAGRATMTLDKGKLRWHVTKKPKGEYWFPDSVVLSRKKEAVMEIADKPAAWVLAQNLGTEARGLEGDGKFKEALGKIEKAIKLDSSDWTNYETRGTINMGLKQYDTAIGDLTRAMELCPPDTQNMMKPNRGECYVQTKRADLAIKDTTDAINSLSKEVKEKPGLAAYLAKAHRNRALAYKLNGKNDLAAEDGLKVKYYEDLTKKSAFR